jgi:hypothetical protein
MTRLKFARSAASCVVQSRLAALDYPSSVMLCMTSSPARGEERVLHAVFSSTRPSSSIIFSRMMNFCALPVTVIGNSSTKRTYLGAL